MQKGKFLVTLYLLIAGFGLFATRAHSSDLQVKVEKLIRLRNGQAIDIDSVGAEEMVIENDSGFTSVTKGVLISNNAQFHCKAGNAQLGDGAGDFWLNFNTTIRVINGDIEVMQGQLFTDNSGRRFILATDLSIDANLATDLNAGDFSQELNKAFTNHGITFRTPRVEIQEQSIQWRIIDISSQQAYIVHSYPGKLRISIEVVPNGTEFYLRATGNGKPAVVYVFKGQVQVGLKTLNTDFPAATIGRGGITRISHTNIPKEIENELFQVRMWKDEISRFTTPISSPQPTQNKSIFKSPTFYLTSLGALGLGAVIYRLVSPGKESPSQPSRLTVTVSF